MQLMNMECEAELTEIRKLLMQGSLTRSQYLRQSALILHEYYGPDWRYYLGLVAAQQFGYLPQLIDDPDYINRE